MLMQKQLPIIFTVLIALFISIGVISVFAKRGAVDTSKTEVLDPLAKSKSIFSYFLKQKPKPKKIIFGYLPYWSIDKLKYMQLDKLTDIAYFGLYLNGDGTFMETVEDGTAEQGHYVWRNSKDLADFIKFAKKSGIRISLTVISHDDEKSDQILTCKECWPTLLANIKAELDFHNIKDVNLNFEYVDFQKAEVADAYTELTDYLNKELDLAYGSSFVTVATFADSFVKPRVTNVEALGKVSDGLFIMAYDFRYSASDSAGPLSPINGIGVNSSYDLQTMLADYMRVVPPSKLIMGVPYYGYNWVVENHEPFAKRIPGDDSIGHSQSQAYSDIMDAVSELKPEIKWDELSKTPYYSYTSPETGSIRQVYFENVESLKLKYELVKFNSLAGIGIWALGYDGGYQELWDLLDQEFIN
jgi:spore germination protein YaaH